MSRLETIILYLLTRAKQRGKDNLSKIELFKLLYLLEVEAYKLTGKTFFDSTVSFTRDKNGPISATIYHALNDLDDKYITINSQQKANYPYPRHCISLKKLIKKINLQPSEKIFVNSVIEEYLPMTISNLKNVVYNTEPMKKMQEEERQQKVSVLKGYQIDFSSIPMDEDMVDLISA